jgi:glycosyltransferase involved in cell wall biosynthesis
VHPGPAETPPIISVVIPAYNEGARLPGFVERLTRASLAHGDSHIEFIVSDDGSAPEQAERQRDGVLAAQARLTEAGSPHRFRYVAAERNAGKGSAIRRGWREADPSAGWLAFLDADGAVPAEEFLRLASLAAASPDVDVLAGSRVLMAGRRVERRLFRHLQGRVFATLTDLHFRLGYYDTQCGAKLFRASMLRPLLNRLREDRWLLDVELLVLMREQGARALEVPIDWADAGDSKVRFGVDAARMFWGLRKMHRRLNRPPPRP